MGLQSLQRFRMAAEKGIVGQTQAQTGRLVEKPHVEKRAHGAREADVPGDEKGLHARSLDVPGEIHQLLHGSKSTLGIGTGLQVSRSRAQVASSGGLCPFRRSLEFAVGWSRPVSPDRECAGQCLPARPASRWQLSLRVSRQRPVPAIRHRQRAAAERARDPLRPDSPR